MRIIRVLYAVDKSLFKFFILAYLIPIAATVLAVLIGGFPTDSVVTHVSPMVLVVMMAMVHAPTIAAMIVAFQDEGFKGIKDLFRQLQYWTLEGKWYLYALLIFPSSILASQYLMSLYSESYGPVLVFRIVVVASLFSALWEEIGWTGYATPRMLRILSPLRTAILLGTIHMFWHLAADHWGSISYYGAEYLYAVHFFLWLIGLIVLRIIILWMYVQTRSVVLGWLTHFSYTGGQLYFVSVDIPAVETLLWNTAFVLILLVVVTFLFVRNKDFQEFCKIRQAYA
jgi:membrane protease YdiL (CAAX protease family)